MTIYSLQQQVFVLSFMSGLASADLGTPETLEQDLASAINGLLQDPQFQHLMGSSWSLAWGPVVFQNTGSTVADNAMYVASGRDASDNPVYVVGVAGTNFNSTYDLTEDFDVTLVPWPFAAPSQPGLNPNISQGTVDGLNALLGMSDPKTGKPLTQYLGSVATTKATLIIAGHSLGGALAPGLALALFASAPGPWAKVHVYPTAGPTVGDGDYATFYASTFPSAKDSWGENWNLVVWNSLDVIPHMWALISDLSTLYPSQNITWTQCLGNVQAGLIAKANGAGGTFVQPQNKMLTGTFEAWSGASSSSPMLTYFLTEMLSQHIWAYFDLLNVPEMRNLINTLSNPLAEPEAQPAVIKLCGYWATQYCTHGSGKGQCGSSSNAA